MQQVHLVVAGPIPFSTTLRGRPRRGWLPVAAALSSSSSEQNHYAVLGVNLSATSADIKTAYRLLARKYHPDVSKDCQASEVFKSIRLAYEVLSNESTRTRYDRALKSREDTATTRQWNYDPPRRRTTYKQYYDQTLSEEEEEEGKAKRERGPFRDVLRSAIVSLLLLHAFGSRPSLAFAGVTAFLDGKLDSGYKTGYVVAWVLGGQGGILLSLCLSFTSWACGKTSSGMVAVVMVAVWVGSALSRLVVPLPHGALLALLYLSIKLQLDLNKM